MAAVIQCIALFCKAVEGELLCGAIGREELRSCASHVPLKRLRGGLKRNVTHPDVNAAFSVLFVLGEQFPHVACNEKHNSALGVENGWVTVCVNAQVTSDFAIVATSCAATVET